MAFQQIASGAFMGAIAGGLVGAAYHAMQTRKSSAENLGLEANYLHSDMQLAELVSRFRHLGNHSKDLETLYNTLVTSCDGLLKCYVDSSVYKTKGALQFKANRLAYAAKEAATSLCRRAFKEFQDESSHELLREIKNLEGLCNNHLHNIMLE